MNPRQAVRAAIFAGLIAAAAPGAVHAQSDPQSDNQPSPQQRFQQMKQGFGPLGGMRHAEVDRLYEYDTAATSAEAGLILEHLAQSPLLTMGSIGTTTRGRPIPLAVIADPPVEFKLTTPNGPPAASLGPRGGLAAIGDRAVVLLFGSIHAGELCGTDALLRMLHDFAGHHRAGSDLAPLLRDLVICVVPIYNADGHAEFAADNRPGQNGPAQMGKRHNAQDLDLNRDWIKMDAPETRAMVAFLNAWDPAVIVDTHTTNGSNHRFTLTYQGPKHPAGDREIIEYVRDTMLPTVDTAFEHASGYDTFFYGNFAENHTKWTTYPAEPWYGVAYRGLRNRMSVLTEAYAYASFEDRVVSTQAFCEEVLRYTARHKDDIRQRTKAADARTIEAGRNREPIATKTEARAFVEDVKILGYDEPIESGAHSARAQIDLQTTPTKDYTIPLFNDFVATESVARPAAYLVPAEHTEVIDRLRAHGIAIQTQTADAAPIDATLYRVDSAEKADRAWQGRTMMELRVTPEQRAITPRTGDVIVRTDQPLGSLAAYMLEPTSTGGLSAWGFFQSLSEGGAFPVARIEQLPPQPSDLPARNDIPGDALITD